MRTSTAAFMAGITAGSILIGGLTLYLGAAMSADTAQPTATTKPVVMAGITTDTTREPRTEPVPTSAPAPVTPDADSDSDPVGGDDAAIDPMSAAYNPYLEPTDPEFVTEAEMTTWYALQDVIRQCMTEQGFEYLEWDWRLNEGPQPLRQEWAEKNAWATALYGANRLNPSGVWHESGCSGYGLHITGDTTH